MIVAIVLSCFFSLMMAKPLSLRAHLFVACGVVWCGSCLLDGQVFAPGNLRATADNPAYKRLFEHWVNNRYEKFDMMLYAVFTSMPMVVVQSLSCVHNGVCCCC